jgi:hypothetical protein
LDALLHVYAAVYSMVFAACSAAAAFVVLSISAAFHTAASAMQWQPLYVCWFP